MERKFGIKFEGVRKKIKSFLDTISPVEKEKYNTDIQAIEKFLES